MTHCHFYLRPTKQALTGLGVSGKKESIVTMECWPRATRQDRKFICHFSPLLDIYDKVTTQIFPWSTLRGFMLEF